MNKIAEIIHPIEGFQYSVNIAYDIYDDKKIASYIPTQSSLRIIEDILTNSLQLFVFVYLRNRVNYFLHFLIPP